MKYQNLTVPDETLISEPHTKFGRTYCDALINTADYIAEFPLFLNQTELNIAILELVYLCQRNKGRLKIKFIYADQDRISLMLNDSIALNYSGVYGMFLSPRLTLRICGLSKYDVRKAKLMAGKKLRLLFDSVRFAHDGVKVNAVLKKLPQQITLRIGKSKKNKKIH